jgi:hypothetical protein
MVEHQQRDNPMQPQPLKPFSEPLFPKSTSAYWSKTFMLAMVVCLAVFSVVFYIGLELGAEKIDANAIMAATFWSVIVGLILLIFATTNVRYLRRALGEIHFDGEAISIFDQNRKQMYTANLADCRWFVGSQTWATVPSRHNLFGAGTGEALLIVFPDSTRTPKIRFSKRDRDTLYISGPAIAAVGLTHETRLQWEQALERWNVEKDMRRESLSPPVSQTFFWFWSLLSFPISWFLARGLGRACQDMLIQWNVPADIAEGIAFPLFVPGVIYLLICLNTIPAVWRTQQDVYQQERGWLQQWQSVLFPCFFSAIFIVGFWECIGQKIGWTERSAIAATVMCVIEGLMMIVISWRLLAEPPQVSEPQS